jgi:methyl-accepting chemotaxis protein
MAQQQTFRRRHYFIKKDYQSKFILKFCLLVLGGLILATGLVFVFSYGTVTTHFEHGRLIVKNTAFAIMPAVILTNSITLIIVVLATIMVVLYISHKIAGPMFRFEKELETLATGDLTSKIFLRKADQFLKMSEHFNMVIAALHGKVTGIQELIEELRDAAEKEGTSQDVIDGIATLQNFIDVEFKI